MQFQRGRLLDLFAARLLIAKRATTRLAISMFGVVSLGVAADVFADPSPREICLLGELKTATPESTVKELREHCAGEAETPIPAPEQEAAPANPDASLIGARIHREDAAEANRSTLVPHRRNYFMPITYMAEPNEKPFQEAGAPPDHQFDHAEIKFQLSLKVSLLQSLLADNDQLYFGFTALSFWQAYNSGLSDPFRETDYEPEFFYVVPLPWKLFNSDATLLSFGISHQSNGETVPLSRSWNRIYANLVWEEGDFVFSLKPWWRIPESSKSIPTSPHGDDNPDIEDYLGNFEFNVGYRRNNQEFGLMLRNNLQADNRGAIQLDWTFPMYKRLRGYVQYFNGYGESLIDYNAHMERIGIGIMLSDLL